MRWRELFGCGLAMVLCLVLACVGVARAGVQAGFQSSTDPCGNDPSLVFCYTGDVDTGGNFVDHSGGNLLTDRSEIDDWTESGTCAVTADQWRNPVDGTLDADLLDNTGGANTDHRYLYSASSTSDPHTGSVWVRVDTPHNVTVVLNENGVGVVDTETVAATIFWQRVRVSGSGTGAAAIGLLLYPGESGTATGTAYFYGGQVLPNDRYRTNQGIYLNPADQSVTKPTHDLAPSNSPTRALSDAEYQGNRLQARLFDGVNQWYEKAHHDSMNVNDSDHTYTFVLSGNGFDYFFSHGSAAGGGLILSTVDATTWRAVYGKFLASVNVEQTSATNDGLMHIVQLVREDDIATLYVDGVAGTPVDVSTYGTGGPNGLFLGAAQVGSDPWEGTISFAKLETFARNADELASDREKIWGMATGQGSSFAAWDIARSTTAMKTFKAGGAHIINKKMTEVAANIPRVTLEGLLVEGQSTNSFDYSEQVDQWSMVRASVVANSAVAPDGSTTADTLHEDATGANTHLVYQTGVASVTSGEDWTLSLIVAPDNRDWVAVVLDGVGTSMQGWFNVTRGFIGTMTADVDRSGIEPVGGGFYRVWISGEMNGTVAMDSYIYAAEGDGDNTFDGLNQDSLYLWGAQVEEGTFPTSYIEVPATADVTRTADDITMDPCADAQSCVLPLGFGAAGQPDKLTISFEAKCQYSAAADIGQARSLIEISAAAASTNRVYFELASNGRAWFRLRSSVSGNHNAFTAIDPVDFSQWHRYWGVLDFADLSRMEFWIDGDSSGMSYGSNSGVAEFSLVDAKIRVGQTNAAVVNANCEFRKPLIRAEELRP